MHADLEDLKKTTRQYIYSSWWKFGCLETIYWTLFHTLYDQKDVDIWPIHPFDSSLNCSSTQLSRMSYDVCYIATHGTLPRALHTTSVWQTHIPTVMLQNLVQSLSTRVEIIVTAKAGLNLGYLHYIANLSYIFSKYLWTLTPPHLKTSNMVQ